MTNVNPRPVTLLNKSQASQKQRELFLSMKTTLRERLICAEITHISGRMCVTYKSPDNQFVRAFYDTGGTLINKSYYAGFDAVNKRPIDYLYTKINKL